MASVLTARVRERAVSRLQAFVGRSQYYANSSQHVATVEITSLKHFFLTLGELMDSVIQGFPNFMQSLMSVNAGNQQMQMVTHPPSGNQEGGAQVQIWKCPDKS